MKRILSILFVLVFLSCGQEASDTKSVLENAVPSSSDRGVSLLILGTVQDAGRPHIDCKADCCLPENLSRTPQNVVSLALANAEEKRFFLFEATPDITAQLRLTNEFLPDYPSLPSAVFLTHAHIGHYSGLMYFGKEAKGAKAVPVYNMPRMSVFLKENGPWGQLVTDDNIRLFPMVADSAIAFKSKIRVTPFIVPHRDEYSETVGYIIEGPDKKVLFIPDINKWSVWDRDIVALVEQVDLAFLDGSFYDEKELPGRNMEEIPHPFIIESMALFDGLSPAERNKIHFIHMNHTNPLLDSTSLEYKQVTMKGYRIAQQGELYDL
ncbi:MAG: MBL fold metallo-hydrolase [Eudoraea sp.]|nr:MBL fold metallo-hydrolase [Eudoraea sp.]